MDRIILGQGASNFISVCLCTTTKSPNKPRFISDEFLNIAYKITSAIICTL
jgi:hypothetical protein